MIEFTQKRKEWAKQEAKDKKAKTGEDGEEEEEDDEEPSDDEETVRRMNL